VARLSLAEQRLCSKYWGRADLVYDDEFWEDVVKSYHGTNIPVPLKYNPLSVRRVLDMLDCPPGKCGQCCNYGYTPIFDQDIKRIVDNTDYREEQVRSFLVEKDGALGIDGTNGCPFLKDNVCTIYEFRPDTCYLFPIQYAIKARMDGEDCEQMVIRLKCAPGLKILRTLFTEAVEGGYFMLLPDLSLVPKWRKDG